MRMLVGWIALAFLASFVAAYMAASWAVSTGLQERTEHVDVQEHQEQEASFIVEC